MTFEKAILEGLDDVIVHLAGKKSQGQQIVVVPSEINVAEIRKGLGMSQQEFALRFGFPLRTLQNWEGNRRQPEGAVRAYLTAIKNDPVAVANALAHEGTSPQ